MFFVALLIFSFNISNVSTRVFVATLSVILATLIGWCIWTARKSTENDSIWKTSTVVFGRTARVLFKPVKKLNPYRARRVPQHSRQDRHITVTEVKV